MSGKVNLPGDMITKFCPQTMFVYGTYSEDGGADFGLFNWFSYCWDGECCVMACIGGEKLTKDNIRRSGVFSANLVTEALLPLADYFGHKKGYAKDKMNIAVEIAKGSILEAPVLAESPWVAELQVEKSVKLDDSEIFICRIKNIIADKELSEDGEEFPLHRVKPVLMSVGDFYSVGGVIGKSGSLDLKISK